MGKADIYSHVVRLFVAIMCLFFFCRNLHAQQYAIYQNINTANGLPSNYTLSVCEDESGFLWVGTDKGLCRYDGFRWQVWDTDNGLPGNYVNEVISDKHGGVWLKIAEKGYYHFQVNTGLAQRIPLLNGQSLQTDAEGSLFAQLLGGDSTVNGYLFHSTNFTKPELVYTLKQSGQRAIVTNDPIKKQLVCFYSTTSQQPAIQKSIVSKWRVIFIPLPPDVYVSRFYHASESTLVTDKALIRFSKDHQIISRVPVQLNSTAVVSYSSDSVIITKTDLFKLKSDGQVQYKLSLFKPEDSYAYTYATIHGQFVYNVKTGCYFIDNSGIKTFYNKQTGLACDYVNQVYQAKDGTIIICTLGAGLQLMKDNYRSTFVTGSVAVRDILPAENEWYVLAGDHVYKTTYSNRFTKVGKAGTSPLCLYKASDTLLVGSLRGVNSYKLKTTSLLPQNFWECNAGVSSIMKVADCYLAGTYGNRIIKFSYKSAAVLLQPYPLGIVEKLIPVHHGFAALSFEDGVFLTNIETNTTIQLTHKQGLISNSVYSVYSLGDTLWVGTKGGLNICVNGKVASTIAFSDNLSNEKVLYSFRDTQKKLWAVSTRFLCQVINGRLQPVTSSSLIPEDEQLTTAAYNANTNELAVGSNKTFSIVNLDRVHTHSVVESPKLAQVVVDGKLQRASSFQLPYRFSGVYFTVEPVAASPLSPGHYFYKVPEKENVWTELLDSFTISFSGLRPGNYTLLLKAINADGYESRVTRVASFKVQRPWWLQWPAIVAALLLLCFTMAFIIQAVAKAKHRKKDAQLRLQQSLRDERERISKDLHDHLGANLATIIAQADNIEATLNKGDIASASATVQSLSSQSRETMSVLRETIWAVQEYEHLLSEFILRIRTVLQRMLASTGIQWHVENACESDILLSPTQTLHMFRIMQEATNNVVKHSKATVVQYLFCSPDTILQMTIVDNGCGLPTDKKLESNGLANIHERVGYLKGTITVAGDSGTTIQITIPIEHRLSV